MIAGRDVRKELQQVVAIDSEAGVMKLLLDKNASVEELLGALIKLNAVVVKLLMYIRTNQSIDLKSRGLMTEEHETK